METTEIINRIRSVTTAEALSEVGDLIRAQPGQMAPEVQTALLEKLDEFTARAKAAREDAMATLKLHGVEYPLTDWLTPANYARKFGLKNSMVVTNWIARGVIPAENVKEIPELDLRLVKAVEYSPRAYRATAGEDKDA